MILLYYCKNWYLLLLLPNSLQIIVCHNDTYFEDDNLSNYFKIIISGVNIYIILLLQVCKQKQYQSYYVSRKNISLDL